tara:strand:+ start:885 stop:1100 length:216 start_codon:yes stop_codon:yes gene_type:complete
MTIQTQFAKQLQILIDATLGNVILDSEYPILFNEVCKFYERRGVQFWGDYEDDYSKCIEYLTADLYEAQLA